MAVLTQTKLPVLVHYAAAEHPFKDHVAPEDTVGQLKQRVLAAFGLTDGRASDGEAVTYTLYHGKTPLEDSKQALGGLAGQRHGLQLKLGQQITQG
jgi:hypothetical protein